MNLIRSRPKFGGILPLVLAAAVSTAPASAQEGADLFGMSLEELLQVRVLASLTHLAPGEAPASITVITSDDLRFTPHRNIYDVLEVYVPGALWMNREDGPTLGVRGTLVDRNYKYLLLVNGRLMNSRGQAGAMSELQQWSLGDIRRIEIVRGPGSVTHGPGAVAGVISIVTDDATSDLPNRIGVRHVGEYGSRGASARGAFDGDGFGLYGFASVTRTDGLQAPHFIVDDNIDLGFIGQDVEQDSEALDYFGDYLDDPQVKLHLDARVAEAWRLWFRYTQQGSMWSGNETKTVFGGRPLNQQGVRDRQWTATAENATRLSDHATLTSWLGLGSLDIEGRGGSVRDPNPASPLNKRIDFAESRIFGRVVMNWQRPGGIEFAAGAEWTRDSYGAGWGDDPRDMRLGPRGVIVNGPDSRAIDPDSKGSAARFGNEVFVGDGWSTQSVAGFAEANLELSSSFRTVLSGRADHTTDSDWLLSPRVALIADLGSSRYLKLIAQRSHRHNNAAEILIDVENGVDPDSEALTSVELAYSQRPTEGLSLDVAGFWNDAEVIAWDGLVNSVLRVGDLQVLGFEGTADYQWDGGRAGVSYSHVKQLDWKLNPGVTKSGISYADYRQPLDWHEVPRPLQTGVGNDLNNWPNQAVKAYGRISPTDRLFFHVDSRVLWDFQGAKDGLEGIRRAIRSYGIGSEFEEAVAVLDEEGVHDADVRLNASLTWVLAEGFDLQVFAQNLLSSAGNKRYGYDSGNDDPAPRRVRFVEEPRAFGVRLGWAF